MVLRPVAESALQKIIHLIKEAQQQKAPAQQFTDRFGTSTPTACWGCRFVMFFVWWLGFGLPPFASGAAHSAFYRAMTLLVVASPCALVLSIPSAVLAAIAWGARHGILFRGGAAVEKLADVDTVALDKTGTLTTGELRVETVESFPPGRETEMAQLAYSLERLSTHPLARAITRYGKQQRLQPLEFDHFESVTGQGLRGRLDGDECLLGPPRMARRAGAHRIAPESWIARRQRRSAANARLAFRKSGWRMALCSAGSSCATIFARRRGTWWKSCAARACEPSCSPATARPRPNICGRSCGSTTFAPN